MLLLAFQIGDIRDGLNHVISDDFLVPDSDFLWPLPLHLFEAVERSHGTTVLMLLHRLPRDGQSCPHWNPLPDLFAGLPQHGLRLGTVTTNKREQQNKR